MELSTHRFAIPAAQCAMWASAQTPMLMNSSRLGTRHLSSTSLSRAHMYSRSVGSCEASCGVWTAFLSPWQVIDITVERTPHDQTCVTGRGTLTRP